MRLNFSCKRSLAIFLTTGSLLGMLMVTDANAAQRRQTSPLPLSQVQGVSVKQIPALKKAGITTVAKLAKAQSYYLAKVLKINSLKAKSIIVSAKARSRQLNQTYAIAKTKFRINRKAKSALLGNDYASLIAATNECTILVRKVCGSENQCDSSPGCSPAKQLLERYNQQGSNASVAESCIAALEDEIVFNNCNN